jgi:hypothetical protein
MQRLLGQAAQRNNVGMASWVIDPVSAERAGHSADPRGTNIQRRMNRLLLTLAITVAASGLIFPKPTVAQPRPAGEKAERVQIIKGPALESATDNSAIMRWTPTPAGGTVVHYGTDPKNLSQTAKSPNRWNKNLPTWCTGCVSAASRRGRPTTTRLSPCRPMAVARERRAL